MTWLSAASERERFVEDLLGHMALEEKIGQLDLYHDGTAPGLEAAIAAGQIGGVAGAGDARRLQALATERSRLGIPLLLFDPQVEVAISPWALAAAWDEELARLAGATAAETALRRGYNALVGPGVAAPGGTALMSPAAHLATEDGLLAARLSAAFLAGADDHAATGTTQVLAVARWASGSVQHEQGWAGELLARAAPLAIDSRAIDRTAALRTGFDGLLVAECRQLHARLRDRFATTSTRTIQEAAERAIAEGEIAEHHIDAAVRAVLGVKHALGLFRQTERLAAETTGAALALPVAAAMRRKAMVLLRNEAGLLPLSPVSDRVLVVGPASGPAASCAEALARSSISYAAAPGLAIRQNEERWSDPHPGDALALSLTRDAAQRADFVIAVLDERHFAPATGAGFPRPTATALAMLRALSSARTRVAALIVTDTPVDLAEAESHVAAVLQCWGTGAGFEEALSDILSGRHAPQGRMPVSVGRYTFGQGIGFGESVFSAFRVAVTPQGVAASLRVRNAGSFALRETVQLYLEDARGAVPRLIDFVDLALAPGEEAPLGFALEARHFAAGPIGSHDVQPGRYTLSVGKDRGRRLSAAIDIAAPLARAMSVQGARHLRLAAS